MTCVQIVGPNIWTSVSVTFGPQNSPQRDGGSASRQLQLASWNPRLAPRPDLVNAPRVKSLSRHLRKRLELPLEAYNYLPYPQSPVYPAFYRGCPVSTGVWNVLKGLSGSQLTMTMSSILHSVGSREGARKTGMTGWRRAHTCLHSAYLDVLCTCHSRTATVVRRFSLLLDGVMSPTN